MRSARLVCLPLAGALLASISLASEKDSPAGMETLGVPTTELHTLDTVTIASQDSFIAWVPPAVCSQDGDVYLLKIPEAPAAGAAESEDNQLNPHEVLRIGGDGEERVTIDLASVPRFQKADGFSTFAIALDNKANLHALVSVHWSEESEHHEESGQYLVSFDEKGKHQSQVAVDWHEIVVQRFEVFGSGDFLLLGRRGNTDEVRLVVLSRSAGTLEDVTGWPTSTPVYQDAPSRGGTAQLEHMVRGHDGRIYATFQDETQDIVYAVDSAGRGEKVFELERLEGRPRLVGWSSADHRLAATYFDPEQPTGDAGGGTWWIAVYSAPGGYGELDSVYGPAPGPPLCQQHKGSRDKFTFLMNGANLVTMAP